VRVPSAGTPTTPLDWIAGCIGADVDAFEEAAAAFAGVDWCRVTGSGTVALYLSLQLLAERSNRREVVLPAYTAPSLVLPIRKAGLVPVLCDVNPETLNSGSIDLLGRVGSETLAVLPVHMFGSPMNIRELVNQLSRSGVSVIEDACSSMGSTISGRQTGTFGEIGFTSFNRGKNMATLAGGALFTENAELRAGLESAIQTIPGPGMKSRLLTPLLAGGLAAAVRPAGYTFLYPLVARFKYTELHTDFDIKSFGRFQAGLGRRLIRRMSKIAGARRERSALLQHALLDVDGVQLQRTLPETDVVYNQFPILLPDERVREGVHSAILETGLEATRLYPDPIHHIYDDLRAIGDHDPFPTATALSKRLLLFPVHPTVPMKVLERAVDALRRVMNSPATPRG